VCRHFEVVDKERFENLGLYCSKKSSAKIGVWDDVEVIEGRSIRSNDYRGRFDRFNIKLASSNFRE
jgi:hypothetical protein